MDKAPTPRWFARLIVAVWISMVVLLFPLPSQKIELIPEANPVLREKIILREQATTGLGRAELERAVAKKLQRESWDIQVRWAVKAIVVFAGIAAAIMVLRGVIHSSYGAVLLSWTYLMGWALQVLATQSPAYRTVVDTYLANAYNELSVESAWAN